MTANEPITGTLQEIQRMSTEDGPGIRTTVFMKGCPMKCPWCHNPESLSLLPQTQWIRSRCIACLTCLEICPNQGLNMTADGMSIDRSRCQGCGECAEACPTNAMQLLGKKWELGALVHELLKDRPYFAQSGGGVTISGGESTLQWRFTSALLQELKQAGIHTAIDTCGIASRVALDAILPYTDLVLYDLKEMDARLHQEFTGCSLTKVLENLDYLTGFIQSHPLPSELWVRTPLIPGATARQDNLTAIGSYLAAACGETLSRWDLLAFNNLCKDKYLRLGLDWPYKDAPLLTQEALEGLANAAQHSGVDPARVHWSGSTRLKREPPAES
jgi:pyruvate formate lyase activating enzyme